MMDKKKPVSLDMLIALGGKDKGGPPSMSKSPMSDKYSSDDDSGPNPDPNGEEDSSLPPDFEAAYEEYSAKPSAQSLWDAVKSCVDAMKE